MKIASISDIHIGTQAVPSYEILHNLQSHFYPKVLEADLINLGGDITDKTFGFGSVDAQITVTFFQQLLDLCEKEKKPLFVLRGTLSHDRDHLDTLETTAKKWNTPLYYVKTVKVLHIKELDIWVAGIPDNLPHKTVQDVLQDIKQQMKDHGIKELDYVFIHGYFDFVLPPAAKPPHHVFTEEMFPFVKHKILVGHVHTAASKGKVHYNGSFCRLNHGEEEAKGFLFTETVKDRTKVTFIENKDARPFKTLELSSKLSIEEGVQKVSKVLSGLPCDMAGAIRLVCSNVELRRALMKWIGHNYPQMKISVKIPKSIKDEDGSKKSEDGELEVLQEITSQNLSSMIHQYITSENTEVTLPLQRIESLMG